MSRSLLLFGCLAVFASCGCGPSPATVVARHRPSIDAIRAKLKQIADKVPQGVSDQAAAKPLDPPLVMIHEGEEADRSNTEVMMFEEVVDEYAEPDFDLRLSNDLTACLFWTRPDAEHASRGDGKFMQKSLEQASAARYLVVHRVVRLELPKVVRDNLYTPGRIAVEGSVFDLQTEELLATYTIDATAKDNVHATSRDGESMAEAIERFAKSSLWSAVRDQAAEKLARVTNGTVQFERGSRRYEPTGTSAPPTDNSAPQSPVVVAPPPVTPPPVAVQPPRPRDKKPFERPRQPRRDAAIPPPPDLPAPTAPSLAGPSQVYLRSLPTEAAEVLTQDEHRLLREFSVRSVPFQNGFYAHPPAARQPARIVVALGKGFQRLQGAAGQSDGFPEQSFSPLVFRIVGDGRELWRSPAIQRHGEWRPFDVDVANVERLELFVDCPGDHSFAWGVWMDPVLTKK